MSIKNLNLAQFFTLDQNIQRLERLPEIKTPVMSLVYPEDKRSNYPRSFIALKDLPKEVRNVPVVRRGTQAVPLADKKGAEGYEPFPVEVSMTLTAADLNDIVSLEYATQQAEIDQKVDRMRRTTRATTEALAAQSLTGKIHYAVRGALADNSELYAADFGQTKAYAPAAMWDGASTTLAQIVKDCLAMADMVSGNGFGDQVAILVGSAAFSLVLDLIMKQPSNILSISVENGEINFPGFKLRRLASTYYDYQAKASAPVIPNKKACAVALDAPHWLPYCAIDDVDADLAPLPFFSKAVKVENPSGWELYGKSKPFPVPIVDALCWANIQA